MRRADRALSGRRSLAKSQVDLQETVFHRGSSGLYQHLQNRSNQLPINSVDSFVHPDKQLELQSREVELNKAVSEAMERLCAVDGEVEKAKGEVCVFVLSDSFK